MKQKAISRITGEIDKILEEKNTPAFGFIDDERSVIWSVALDDGRLLGRRIITMKYDSNGEYMDYVSVPYEISEACEEIYDRIVGDFVDCFGEDLYYGCGRDKGLFDDIAAPDDDGLLYLLGLFGKTYGEFIQDVIFEVGNRIDMCDIPDGEDDDEAEEEPSPEDVALAQDERLSRRVMGHQCEAYLMIEYEDPTKAVYWEFARADGDMWYQRVDMEFIDYVSLCYSEYSHVSMSDDDAMAALQDVVSACFTEDYCYCEELGNPLTLIGLDPDDPGIE